jgi:acetoin utilization deacetylase AcuC-like enzyme
MSNIFIGDLALKYGIATHIGGGTHHAFRDFGSGFTIFNDMAVSAMHLIT